MGLPVFAAQFSQVAGKGDRVLGVGCGYGLNLVNHAGLFKEGTGLDESDSMLKLARMTEEEFLKRFSPRKEGERVAIHHTVVLMGTVVK